MDIDKPFNFALDFIQLCCLIWACFEFAVRLLTCSSKLDFIKSPLNIIDFLSIIPFFIWILVSDYYIFSAVRVLMLFKVSRHSTGLKLFGKTLFKSLKELSILLLLFLIAMILFATLIYYFEKDNENTEFQSIPHSLWFKNDLKVI